MQKFVSLKDAADLIAATGSDVTYALLGEPGIGKTALLQGLADRLGLRAVYMDVPTLDIADVGVPMPDHETKTTRLYPNEHWGFHLDEPLLVCLDEFSKGDEPVMLALHPLLTKVGGYRRIGATKLHPDSIVFITGNLVTDGVRDKLLAHTLERMTRLYIRKPSKEEWCEWAIGNGLDPGLVSWAHMNDKVFASYTDGALTEDDWVFNPSNAAQRGNPFVTPRSLTACSFIVGAYSESKINYKQCSAALQGKIGVSAAQSLMAHLDLGSQLPSPDEIRAAPTTCSLPQSAPAQIMCVLNALHWIPGKDKVAADMRTDLDAWFKFFERLPKEAQSMFIEAVIASGKKAKTDRVTNAASRLSEVMVTHPAFKAWATANHYLF